MKSLHKFRHGLDTVLSWVCALLFAAMVVVGTYQIVTRYFFGRPSTVSEELLTYSFTWMALLSSALVFGKRDHMRMGKNNSYIVNILSFFMPFGKSRNGPSKPQHGLLVKSEDR